MGRKHDISQTMGQTDRQSLNCICALGWSSQQMESIRAVCSYIWDSQQRRQQRLAEQAGPSKAVLHSCRQSQRPRIPVMYTLGNYKLNSDALDLSWSTPLFDLKRFLN